MNGRIGGWLACGLLAAASAWSQERIVGYFSNWGLYDATPYTFKDVPYERFTHLQYSFFQTNSAGRILPSDAYSDSLQLDSLVARAHAAGVKVLVSVGGWTLSDSFPAMAANPASRLRFASEAKALLARYDLDGIDLDWEYPGYAAHSGTASDATNFPLLLGAIRDSIGPTKLLTIAGPTSGWMGQNYRVDQIKDKIDWFGIMTYDMTGDWMPTTWHNSPLYAYGGADNWSCAQAVDYWLGRGMPASKLHLGLALYGHTFLGASSPTSAFTGLGPVDGYLSYATIHARIASGQYTRHWDDAAKVPYATGTGGFYATYDDTVSLREKVAYMKSKGLGGVIIWEIKEDRLDDGSQPLVKAIDEAIRGASSSVKRVAASERQSPATIRLHEVQLTETAVLRIPDVTGRR